ncbi:MAG: 5,10-methylenetetrahydromethanopterin reductase [Halobacteriaceae archaeon]
MVEWSLAGLELTPEVPADTTAERAAAAEAAGLDTVLMACHYNNRDPFAALALAARKTETVQLGPAAANPYEVHPVTLASRIATLQETAGGRALFGLAAGDRSTLRSLGIDRERPLRRVLETMRVSRKLLAGDRVEHDGTFTAPDAGLNYAVPPVPTYIGAQGPDMLRMAGKHADGVLVNAAHPEEYTWAADRIAEGAAARSPGRADVDVVAYAATSVAADVERARDAARPPVAFIAASAPDPVLDRHGIDGEIAARIGAKIEAGAFSAAFEMVTPAMIEVFAVAGTPAVVAERLTALGAYVDGIVAGAPLGPDVDEAISLVAEAIDRSVPG